MALPNSEMLHGQAMHLHVGLVLLLDLATPRASGHVVITHILAKMHHGEDMMTKQKNLGWTGAGRNELPSCKIVFRFAPKRTSWACFGHNSSVLFVRVIMCL